MSAPDIQKRMTLDEWQEFSESFRYMGLSLPEIREAINFWRSHYGIKSEGEKVVLSTINVSHCCKTDLCGLECQLHNCHKIE